MTLRNDLKAAIKAGKISEAAWLNAVRVNVLLMAPIAPHVSEELWAMMGQPYSVHQQTWPVYDAEKAKEDEVALVVMVNGKPRDSVTVPAGISEDEAKRLALETAAVRKALNGGDGAPREPKKVLFIAGRGGQEPKVNVVV
jgi:leucyl-tRNA synthetase